MVNEFMEYLQRQGKSKSTVKSYGEKVRLYVRCCLDSFGSQPGQLYRVNVLDYLSYMRTIKKYSPTSRIECVNLRLEQADLLAREIYVIGKGDKQRTVYLNDKTVHAIWDI